ncbi:MAG TPA: ATP-binding cassette domain-containing protein [Solirubrobacteraceae bacterium]|nr:ATP-binding cassette domain-containing protein [Solirubrobacteraceae bacterium]
MGETSATDRSSAPRAVARAGEEVLGLQRVTVRFGQLTALDEVSLSVARGCLLGLAGQNGAGKTTLFNVVCGNVRPSCGEVLLAGRAFRPRSYADARRAGVFRVTQELALFPNLTVAENVVLGAGGRFSRAGVLRAGELVAAVRSFMEEVGLDGIDPRRRLDELPNATRQVVEIVRALFECRESGLEAPLILLDEPTSGLSFAQVDLLRSQLEPLRARAAIVMTSHRGQELLDFSDRIAVLRGGRLVAEGVRGDFDAALLGELIAGPEHAHLLAAGRPVGAAQERSPARRSRPDAQGAEGGDHPAATPSLRLAALRVGAAEVSLCVMPGERVGLISDGDLAGRVLRTVAGIEPRRHGEVWIAGRRVSPGTRAFVRAGAAFVSGERGDALMLMQPIAWNATLPQVAAGHGAELVASPGRERAWTRELIDSHRMRAPDPRDPVGALSGGTQQRLLIARALALQPSLVLLDRPTRGVDIAAKAAIYAAVARAAGRDGVAFLLFSDELEEYTELCDRIVLLDGASGAVLRSWSQPDQEASAASLEAALRSMEVAEPRRG